MSDRTCPNCGTEAPAAYCPECGQEQRERTIPTVREWVSEIMDELFMVEARLPRTLRALVWPPGRLWAEWRRGRRARYMRPLRVYLLAAIPFFLLVSSVDPHAPDRGGGPLYLYGVLAESVFRDNAPELTEAPDWPGPMGPMPDSVRSDPAAVTAWRAEYARREAVRRERRAADERRLDRSFAAAMELLPIATGLIMVPVLAGLLKLGARRERFASLLVASMHLHTVGYLLAIVTWPIGLAVWAGLLGATLYTAVAMYRVGVRTPTVMVYNVMVVPVLYGLAFIISNLLLLSAAARLAPGWVYGG